MGCFLEFGLIEQLFYVQKNLDINLSNDCLEIISVRICFRICICILSLIL